MNPTFNLIDEPWIPCIDLEGNRIELSLSETLARAHTLRAVYGETPVVTAALYRLLLAVLQRVYMPDSMAAWGALWARKRWETAPLDAYFAQWRHRFDLFDSVRPFYQAADPRVKPRPVADLILGKTSGATLFDHYTEDRDFVLTPAEAVRGLVTAQSFRFGGTKGPKLQFTDGSWARDVIFFVEGDNLFEHLALNLLCYIPGEKEPIQNFEDDQPAWEMEDPYFPQRTLPLGYLDYLTWQNRRILLSPEVQEGNIVVRQATMGPGLKLDSSAMAEEAHNFEPMKLYQESRKQGLVPLRFRTDRALWRDSVALLGVHDTPDMTGVRPPLILMWLKHLVDAGYLDAADKVKRYRIKALGTASKTGQDLAYFYRAEHMPLPLAYLEDEGLVSDLSDALQNAEDTAGALGQATYVLASTYLAYDPEQKASKEDVGKLTAHLGTESHYWSRLEMPFHTLVVDLPQDRDGARIGWQETLRRTAWDALGHAERGVGHDVRALKAQVRARERLAALLAKALPALKEET